MIIDLSPPQLLALLDLLNKIYLDHFGKSLDVYQTAQFSQDLYFFFQEQEASIGKSNLQELRKLFVLIEEQQWRELEAHPKRRKNLATPNAICEASGQRSWPHYWKKVAPEYEDIWQEMQGIVTQVVSVYTQPQPLGEEQVLMVARKCNAAQAEALNHNWHQASLHLRAAMSIIKQLPDKGR